MLYSRSFRLLQVSCRVTSSQDTEQILQKHVALYHHLFAVHVGTSRMSLHHIQSTFSLSSYSLSLVRNSLLRRHDSTKRTPASLQNTTLNKQFFAVTCLLVTISNFSVCRSAQPNHQPVTHTAANCRLSQYTKLRANTGSYATPPIDRLFFDIT